MKDVASEFNPDLAELECVDWFDALDEFAEEHGHFEPLGDHHAAAFIEAGTKLVVTFESYQDVMEHSDQGEPRGFTFVRAFGWSHLCIVADHPSWFRDKRIWQYFDRLIDDGFFEDFDQVLFYGVHRGAYAAAAYSVACPGSRVLAIRPVATLASQIAGWDPRYTEARRLDFSTRYGFAPNMIEATDRTYTVFDPRYRYDAMHAALFTRPNVTALHTPFLEERVEQSIHAMGIMADMVSAAMEGTLDHASFGAMFRARKTHVPYLRNIVQCLSEAGHLGRAAKVCRLVLSDRQRPYFLRRLKEIEAELERNAQG